MGFLQYVSPTLQLLLGVLVYGETVSGIRGVAFSFVLVALAVFALTRIKKAGAV
jgi:chloramphenicol-sensitive protein RarD